MEDRYWTVRTDEGACIVVEAQNPIEAKKLAEDRMMVLPHLKTAGGFVPRG